MSVLERGADVARAILEARDGRELRDHTFVRALLVEAYAKGVIAGIVQSQAAVSATHAKVRAELTET